MERLPKDIWEAVFTCLPLADVVRSGTVCKQWKSFLSSPHFIRHYSAAAKNKNSWVAIVDQYDVAPTGRRFLNLYDSYHHNSLQLDLTFLPLEFTIPVAASQGLVCFSGLFTNFLCLCNPLAKTYRILPALRQGLFRPFTLIIQGPEIESYRVLVIADGLQSLYSTEENRWVNYDLHQNRVKSVVLASNGVFYGLEDVGSDWHPSWRFVCSQIDAGLIWTSVGLNWMDISDVVNEPCLIRGRGDCLFMAGGMKTSLSLNSACSTFVILKLDINSLEWNEAGRMPAEYYQHFNPSGGFSIFGGEKGVYFSARSVGRLVLWDVSDADKGSWRWVDNFAAVSSTAVCTGFAFDVRLDAAP